MSDNINGFPVPEKPETREEQYLSAIAQVTPATQIPPKPLTRVEAYLNKIVENGTGGGGGGTTNYNALENKPQINSHELTGNKSSSDLGLQAALTEAQLAAVNSGINSTEVAQIETNKTNISLKANTSDIANIVIDDFYIDNINLINTNNLAQGYISSWVGTITDSNVYYTSDFIPILSGQSITISPSLRFFLAYTAQKNGIQSSYINTEQKTAYTYTAAEDGYIRFTFNKANITSQQAEYGTTATWYIPSTEKRLLNGYRISQEDNEAIDNKITNSVLNAYLLANKMWYPCGDSFTEGDFTGLQESDYIFNNGEKYAGRKKVYPYYIGNRTNMKVSNMAVSGMTLAQHSGSTAGSCFTYPEGKYTQIPSDADYITLYFGINDSHVNIPIGTADDVTNETFCGAWNVVFDWIYTNRPNAKVGVIISNGCDTTEYPTATIAMCKKWGIAYLDINGDETLPAVIRTNMRTGLDPAVKQKIIEKYRVTTTNLHPNVKAHEDESYMIQQFLERL